eukprot:TRINITY_DN307_c0_g1_i1.p1 TRINITY_DN307_c0_g1~~TRINITY_DN307_c0_g1_i1.p1  ORF type:complete len:330 (+),score=85.50 TRINITY_DN307_c0_g1_i1:61-990(+)
MAFGVPVTSMSGVPVTTMPGVPVTSMPSVPVTSMPTIQTHMAPATYHAMPVSPVTYMAPSPATYVAPAAVHAGVTYHHGGVQQPGGVSVPFATIGMGPQMAAIDARLLQNGHVIHEAAITREDLIAQGRLIEDPQREQALIQHAQAMPGAMASAHAVLTNVFEHHDPATHDQFAHGQHQQQHEQLPPQTLEVSILEAHGLAHLNFTGDNMYTVAEIPRGMLHHSPKIETQVQKGTLDPVWNELHDLEGWVPGEPLVFTVYDEGMVGSKTEGKAQLNSEDFYPQGFEGPLALEGLQDATIIVRVVPVPLQ